MSLDAGQSKPPWGMPTVRIDDLIIHPRDRDLIAGTHGRSIWILEDISALEQMTDQTMTTDAVLFDVRPATAWVSDIQKQITVGGQKVFRAANPDPGTAISYWLKADAGNVRVDISDVTGRVVRTIDGTKTAGLNRVRWNLQGTPAGRGGPGGQAAAPAPVATPTTSAPATQAAATNPPATPPAGGQQGAGREDRPAATPAAAAPAPAQAAQGGGGGGGGRGRGGFGAPALPPGSYLVRLTVDGKVIGQKTVVVEADSIQ